MIQMQLNSLKKRFVSIYYMSKATLKIIHTIVTSGLMAYNEEEVTRELVRDPFQHDLQDILVPLSHNDHTGTNSPLRTAYEKAQKWPMRYIEAQQLIQGEISRPIDVDLEDEDEDDLCISSIHPKLKLLKDFDVNSSNYVKVSEAGTTNNSPYYYINIISLTSLRQEIEHSNRWHLYSKTRKRRPRSSHRRNV